MNEEELGQLRKRFIGQLKVAVHNGMRDWYLCDHPLECVHKRCKQALDARAMVTQMMGLDAEGNVPAAFENVFATIEALVAERDALLAERRAAKEKNQQVTDPVQVKLQAATDGKKAKEKDWRNPLERQLQLATAAALKLLVAANNEYNDQLDTLVAGAEEKVEKAKDDDHHQREMEHFVAGLMTARRSFKRTVGTAVMSVLGVVRKVDDDG